MAFDDFLRQNYPQLGGNLTATPVPGMTAPVQFTPMPNTAPGDAAAAQVQANDQAVLAQQAQDQATARAQQIVAASRERIGAQEDRGGGFLQPLRNVVNTVVDYPSTLRGAVENIIDNPTSIGAWGGAAMQAASPAFALADIPNQYWKEARGEILYRAASGDEQFFDILGMFIPGGSVTLSGIYMGLDAGLDDSTKQKIMTAHDEGYNGFTGGTAVYEAAIGLTDDWHPVAKYSFRIVNEVVNDPTTWIGVGAAAQARQVGKLGQIGRSADDFAALSRTGKVGAIVEDIKTTRDPLLAADAALRGINYVPDQVMFGPFGYAGRKLRERDGGAGNWLFRRSEGDLRRTVEAQENQTLADFARATEPTTMPVDPPMTVVEGGQTLPSTEMGEPVRGTYLLPSGPNEAPDPLPGFDATIDVRPERKVRIRYTYREQATGDAGFVDVMEDGTIRVLPPRQQDWIGVSTIEEGLDQIAMTVPNPPATQRSPVGPNPTYEQQQRYAAQGNIPQHMRPQRDISVKPMTDGTTTVYQVHHETRGDLYIRKQPNGYYRVNDDKGVMVPGPEYANYNDAYEAATTYLLQQPYKFQADPYGRPLHPSTAPNPEGNRIIDEAYRLTQENPGDQNWQWFWQRFRNVNDAYAPVLDEEQAFIDANNPGLRRDLAQGDPELVERNRTVDTATKTLAEANIAFYADYLSSIVNGGERVFTSRRGWNGSPSEQIATFLYGEPTARSRIFRKDINDADAIREAMLTDSNEAARLVIDWFRTKRKVMLSVKQANSVLLPGAQMRPGSTSRDGYVNLANVLEANRSRRREMLRNPETVPMAALPMGEITPPRQVPRVERIERPSANLGMSQPLDEDVLLGELATGEMPGRNPRSGQQTPLPPNPDEIHEAVWNRWRETPTDDRRYDGVMEARKKATDAMAIVTDKRARVNQAQRERAWTTAQFYLSEEERLLHPLEGTVGPMPPPTTTATREVFIPPAAPRIDSPQPQAVEPLGMSTPTDFTVPPEPVPTVDPNQQFADQLADAAGDTARLGDLPARMGMTKPQLTKRLNDLMASGVTQTSDGRTIRLGGSTGVRGGSRGVFNLTTDSGPQPFSTVTVTGQQADVPTVEPPVAQAAPEPVITPEPEAALPPAPENKDLPKLKDLPDVEDHEGIVRMEMRVLARDNQADFATFKQVIDRMGGLGDAATTRQWRLATNILKKLPPEFISPYRYMEMARVGRRLNERTRTLRASKNQADRRQLWGEVQRLQREYDELASAADADVYDITERIRTAPEPTPAAVTPEAAPALPELPEQPPLTTQAEPLPTIDERIEADMARIERERWTDLTPQPGLATDAAPLTLTEMPEPLPGRAVPGRYEQITEEVPVPREDLPPLPEDKWTLPEGVTVDAPQAILPWDIRPSRVEMADVPNAANPPDITLAADTPLVKRVRVRPPGSPNRPEELWSQVVTGDQDESSAALDTLVYDLTGGNVQRDVPEATATLEVDEAISGFGTYTVRDEADGIPAVQITREGDKLIVIAPGGSEDPMVKNIIARAGDGVPVEVRAGLGDAVGKPMGLDGPMTNGVPDPLWDPVYRLHRMAKIDDTEREMLEEIIQISEGKTPKTMRVADFYLYNRSQSESMDEAIRKTMAVFRKHRNAARRAGKEEAGDYDGKLRKLLRLYDTMTDWIRERLMFNPYTGTVSAMLDHVGDTARMLSVGEFGAARKSWRRESLKGGIKSAQGDNSYLLNSDAAKIYSGLEMDIPIETAPNVGREGVDRHRGMSWDKFLAKHVPDAKSQRTFKRALAATGLRGSDFMMELRSGGDIARRVSLSGEEIARQLPKFREDFFKEVDAVARRRPDFNVEAFKADLGEVFGPSTVRKKALDHGLDDGQAEHLMRRWKAQQRPLQELGLKRAGEVLFTYQQTNADQLLRRVFLFHYWYTRASVAYTRTIIRNPYLYANYMRMTEGMEKMAEDQPNSVKGMVKAFTGPGGYAIFMDPLKAVSTAATFRREAFQNGDETEFDKFLDTTGLFLNPMLAAASAVVGVTSNERVDPIASFQLRRVGGAALNMINAETGVLGGKYLGTPFQDKMGKAVEELSDLFGETNQYRDSAATDKVLIRTNIMDRVMARHGIESGTEFGLWPAQAMAELQEAYDAFDQGRPNPDADGAYREWARGNLIKTGASLVAPITTSMRSETKDARAQMSREGSRGAGQELDIINAAPEATELATQDARFDSLFPSNEAGRMFTSPLTGQTQGEVLGAPGMEAYNEYREWRNAARDMGAMAFRERMRRISPSYADYLSRQEAEMGDIFREDPDYYDNISTSYQAYLAAQGERASAYDPSPLPSVDMSRVDASTFVTGGIGGTPAVTKPENLASQITGQLIGYQQQQAEFNRLVQQYFGQEVVFDLLSPQGQALVRQQLGPMGIRIPTMGEAASGYQAWARVQPVGSDTSIDAYVRWLENRAATGQSTRAVPMMAAM